MLRQTKKRHGNLLLCVLVLVFVTTILTSLLTINVSQKNNAWAKASEEGTINSYIAMANVCADAFRDDLEAQAVSMAIAGVDNPGGEDIGVEAFDIVAQKIQTTLKRADVPNAGWAHMLQNPFDAVEFAGVSTGEALQYIEGLLDGASVEIIVTTELSAVGADGDIVFIGNGASITLADINFSVVLKKGAWRIYQEYKLTGEKVCVRVEGAQARFYIDGTAAENVLTQQIVTRA